MKNARWLALILLVACTTCDDPRIVDDTDGFASATPCGAVEAGACTWIGEACEFSAAELNFCGAATAPPRCYQGDEELVGSVAVSIPPPPAPTDLEFTCTLTDGGNPLDAADATVCAFPFDDEPCVTPWQFRSDVWDQNREMVVCDSGAGAQCTLQTSAGARIVIVDADLSVCNSLTISCKLDPGLVQFIPDSYTVDESEGSVTVTVRRSSGNSGDCSVDYATADGTATAGADYVAAAGTLSWVGGESGPKNFTVPIVADGSAEGTETFTASLSNPTGCSLGLLTTATVEIQD